MSLIRLDGVSYRYPLAQQPACRDISLEIAPGRVLGLLGENGAGKSTLAALIRGQLQPDSGEISGRACHSVGLVHQKPSLLPELPLWKAVAGGVPRKKIFLNPRTVQKQLNQLNQGYGLNLDINRLQSSLTQEEAQRGELLEVLYNDPQVILLDEPDFSQSEELENLLHKLAAEKKGVLLITHRLDLARSLCDEIIYLREGRRIEHPRYDVTPPFPVSEVEEQMQGEMLLDLSKLFPSPVHLPLSRGERVVFLGFRESGLSELEEKLLGLLEGQKFGYIPSDSQTRALDFRLSLSENIHLKHQSFQKGWRSPRMQEEQSEAFLKEGQWDLSPEQPLYVLSGGNRQKLLLKRESQQPHPILLAVHPSLGLDQKNHREYLETLKEMKEKGIIYLTSDPKEALDIAGTVAVIYQGKIHALYRGPYPSEERLQQIMMGARP